MYSSTERLLNRDFPHLAELFRFLYRQTKDLSVPENRRREAEMVLKDIRLLAIRAGLENAA